MRIVSMTVALAPALTLAAIANPARAEVIAQSADGFVVREVADVAASPAATWAVMTTPSSWWSAAHTFSGSAANLSLDAVAGGCFCERFPAPAGTRGGGAQHARVIYADPGRTLRLSGALGPLQSEALTGTLTMTLRATEQGTHIQWEYVVGGYMRYKPDEMAPAVDRMLAGQMSLLAAQVAASGKVPARKAAASAAPDGGGNAAVQAAFDAAIKRKASAPPPR